MKLILKKLFELIGYKLIKKKLYDKLLLSSQAYSDLNNLRYLPHSQFENYLNYISFSKSQFRQDLLMLSMLNFKKNGFFVEFGAADGLYFSNTYLLEKHLGWKGILCEPCIGYHKDLPKNRSSFISKKCVWSESNQKIRFNESMEKGYSTIESYSNFDTLSKYRVSNRKYDVETISLIDLLGSYNAPKIIDYLSIDTEGSEYEIMKNFDFEKYKFRFISCEHNENSDKEKLLNLFSQNGYKVIFNEISRIEYLFIPNFKI